mgnify:FL=1
MSLATHHRIIGIHLITLDKSVLEPAADMEWCLELWKLPDGNSENDHVIGMGSRIELDDPGFRRLP